MCRNGTCFVSFRQACVTGLIRIGSVGLIACSGHGDHSGTIDADVPITMKKLHRRLERWRGKRTGRPIQNSELSSTYAKCCAALSREPDCCRAVL
jgi:hypothetical protein